VGLRAKASAPVVAPTAALLAARETVLHGQARNKLHSHRACRFIGHELASWSEWPGRAPSTRRVHWYVASAVLDGLAVADVRRAEKELGA
jgi:hypothetical protein